MYDNGVLKCSGRIPCRLGMSWFEAKNSEENMLMIQVWCLPKMPEEQLRRLHGSIVAAVASVKEFDLKDETEMVCLFPSDMMAYGLGDEIVVEVTDCFEKPKCGFIGRQQLAKALGDAVHAMFPKAFVTGLIHPFQIGQAIWSRRPE